MNLTVEYLKSILSYDKETGLFIWNMRRGGKAKAGGIVGCNSRKDKYILVKLNKRNYFLHRLAWFYVTGEWPIGQIDHIDGNRQNNIFSNLRDVSPSINSQNMRVAKTGSKSGLLGVYPKGNRWRASIYINGLSRRLGYFDTPEEAHEEYLKNKRKFHPGCTI